MKILVVDDQEDARIILKMALEADGHDVATAENGKEALELALPSPPDAIISDILMPGMDGFHLCREVRSDETLRDTHFIFYTATYKERRDEELAMKLGADAFLVKPMDPAEFMRAVKAAMEKEVNKGSPEPEPEVAVLRLYNERLVKKLEKKMLDLERKESALAMGIREFIMKPLALKELSEAVRKALGG